MNGPQVLEERVPLLLLELSLELLPLSMLLRLIPERLLPAEPSELELAYHSLSEVIVRLCTQHTPARAVCTVSPDTTPPWPQIAMPETMPMNTITPHANTLVGVSYPMITCVQAVRAARAVAIYHTRQRCGAPQCTRRR